MPLLTRFKDFFTCFTLKRFSSLLPRSFSIYLPGETSVSNYGDLIGSFESSSGSPIPVYSSYRYSVKPGWLYYPALLILSDLKHKQFLTRNEEAFFDDCIGTRTLSMHPSNADSVVDQISLRLPHLFIPESIQSSKTPVLLPSTSHINKLVSLYRARHSSMLNQLKAASIIDLPSNPSLLEIGFTTGGHSTFAFEKLGFNAFAIDNYYGGLTGQSSLHEINKKLISSDVDFVMGRYNKTTCFPSESLDVFSASVLEHVQDLKSAFVEMHRILKPGGVMIHNYAPFFAHDGGHALGVGDSPWAHVRMSSPDFLKYAQTYRPHEVSDINQWFANALHRDVPQWRMQRLLSSAGFKISLWMTKPSANRWLKDLTPDVMNDCFNTTPGIGIEDLISRSVSFVACKYG